MRRTFLLVTLSLSLILTTTACGTTDNAATVDDAVTLLQDLENNDLWTALDDGLSALDEQSGYKATLTIETVGSTARTSVELTFRTDATHTMLIDVMYGASSEHFYLPASSDSESSRRVIRLEDERIACEVRDLDDLLVRDGLTSALAEAVATLSGDHLLAVIDTPDDAEDVLFLDREATPYDVEARYNAALTLAEDVAAGDSQVIPASDVTLSGTLILDRDTAALLQFTAAASNPSTGESAQVEFIVTKWGLDPVTPPAALANLTPCP